MESTFFPQNSARGLQHHSRCPFATTSAPQLPISSTSVSRQPTSDQDGLHPDYNPWKAGPYRIKMGLQPIIQGHWFEIGPDYESSMAEKHRLLSTYHDLCIMSLPEAHQAAREILRAVTENLSQRYPSRFRLHRDHFHNLGNGNVIDIQAVPAEHALETACSLVQEDLYIMQPRQSTGDTHLTAAAACFLQRVDFTEKLGRSLAGVHAPVPFYDQIAKPMINVFGRGLKVGRPLERFNWAITDDPALFQPELEDETPSAGEVLPVLHKLRGAERMTPGNAGSLAFVRCERQTITRMPQTGAVLFTVRTYVRSLDQALQHRPDLAQRLASALSNLPHEKMPTLGGNWLSAVQQYLALVH